MAVVLTKLPQISSSPDVMAFGHDRPRRRKSASSPHAEATADATADPPPAPSGTPASQKRKKKSRPIQDVDELGHDDSWDSDAIGHHPELSRPRLSRRRSNASSIHEDETAQHEEPEEPVDAVDIGPEEEAVYLVEPVEQDPPSNPPPPALEAPIPAERVDAPTNQPKKRGRKKKQPVVEEVIRDERPVEEAAAVPTEPDPPPQAPEAEEVVKNPKKKRGRPRKSDQAKTAKTAPPPVPAEVPEEPPGKAPDNDAAGASPGQLGEEEPKSKNAPRKRGKRTDDVAEEEPSGKDEVSALREVDANPGIPSRSASSEPAGKKKPAETAAAENQAKARTKETPKPAAAAAATQSKVLYRVGLSKKTRIAPLLKIIRK